MTFIGIILSISAFLNSWVYRTPLYAEKCTGFALLGNSFITCLVVHTGTRSDNFSNSDSISEDLYLHCQEHFAMWTSFLQSVRSHLLFRCSTCGWLSIRVSGLFMLPVMPCSHLSLGSPVFVGQQLGFHDSLWLLTPYSNKRHTFTR